MLLSGNTPDPQKEHYLLYQLPMAKGQQYIHAYAVANGAECYWADEKEDIFNRVQNIWKKMNKPKPTPPQEKQSK